jgi:hypothetical protein
MSGNGRINGLVQAAGVHPAVHRHPDHLDRLKRTRRRPPLTSGCRVRSQPDFARGVDHLGPQTAAIGVRREKAALSSGCKAHRPCIEFLDPHSSERSSPLTRRRREMDSNHRSPVTCELCRRGLPPLPARERERFSAISSARRPIPSSRAGARFEQVVACCAARRLPPAGGTTHIYLTARGVDRVSTRSSDGAMRAATSGSTSSDGLYSGGSSSRRVMMRPPPGG